MTSRNICDFVCYKYPDIYYIESKETEHDNMPWSMIRENQYEGLLKKSEIPHVHAWVIVLFATYQRAFVFDIRDIKSMIDSGKKSININKIDKWPIPYKEILTIPNTRKKLLDYTGQIEDYIPERIIQQS